MEPNNMYIVWAYGFYVMISVLLTMWVARTLSSERAGLPGGSLQQQPRAGKLGEPSIGGRVLSHQHRVRDARPQVRRQADQPATVHRILEHQDWPCALGPRWHALHQSAGVLEYAQARAAQERRAARSAAAMGASGAAAGIHASSCCATGAVIDVYRGLRVGPLSNLDRFHPRAERTAQPLGGIVNKLYILY